MLQRILTKVFGSRNERELKRMWPLVSRVSDLEPKMKGLSDEDLRRCTGKFKERLDRGATLDELLPEAFAVVREVSVRVLGMRHFDVQILGGIVLHEGKIAEMKTGEGKTLCATLPVYLNALSGKGVHVVTVNDYLAKRDAEWMGGIYSFLGLSTGVVVHSQGHLSRQVAYGSDITYGQNNEFGFDYLRDNMKLELGEMVQRKHCYAIVDEVDSILIDEARTPLIISGPSEKPTEHYHIADKIVKHLKQDEHFTVEPKSKQVLLSDAGVKVVEELLQVDNLYDPRNIDMLHHVNNALKAHVSMHRDVDYVVQNGQIIIVDEFTGRLMSGRRWSDGLHQAIEAKEKVHIRQENQTLATITFQNYFRMYEKLAGMTGTADTEAVEFKKIYNLDVVIIPTNMPMIRTDNSDVVFCAEKGKFKAVCDEIVDCSKRGQPVLVGTASIAKSEALSKLLSERGVRHHVLNAKQHEREAAIVAQAGRRGAVTISTNMAGRGTDIVLGGNPAFLVEVKREEDETKYEAELASYVEICAKERAEVLAAGGLHVLGTERHESRRIDNQLRGRSGRQGDAGSSRFYVSLEDDLMKRFGGERMQAIMTRVGMAEDDAIEGTIVARAIENAQKKVEAHHFEIRKHLLEYDDVMNKQREVIYAKRRKILGNEGVEQDLREAIEDVVEDLVLTRVDEKKSTVEWDVAGMFVAFESVFGEKLSIEDFVEKATGAGKELAQEIFDTMRAAATRRYEERKKLLGEERMLQFCRFVYLHSIDYFWKEHLASMDHLKEGINLRGYGQRNPLHEYQREALELFSSMMSSVYVSVVQNVMLSELPTGDEIAAREEAEHEMQKKREARLTTMHESVVGEGQEMGKGEKAAGKEVSHLNRHQRRRQQAVSKASGAPADETDLRSAGLPTSSMQLSSVSAQAKEAKRKKNKMAKESRKKARR
ncbi:MAG: preprotein translocase subunit SecA [Deltaproteobacteria bacterium]|nr:preprotein translocase subunit SecA [Deltaproteobacteria bacterium]